MTVLGEGESEMASASTKVGALAFFTMHAVVNFLLQVIYPVIIHTAHTQSMCLLEYF